MRTCDMYVADLAESATADLSCFQLMMANGVNPISPAFPAVGSPLAALAGLIYKIESGKLSGRRVDQDCWVAVMTPGELISYIDELYDLSWYEGIGSLSHLNRQLNDLLEVIIRLNPEQRYALVAYKA